MRHSDGRFTRARLDRGPSDPATRPVQALRNRATDTWRVVRGAEVLADGLTRDEATAEVQRHAETRDTNQEG